MSRFKTRSKTSAIGKNLANVWQAIWAIIVFTIFAVAWLVQADAINMPDWTNDLRQYEGDEWAKYSAILIVSVCFTFTLTMVGGVMLLREDIR
ncbi:hypothetical protein F66182_9728 [Fusarium sp. NRRL 66182]|nr:hypothetical protein F66182_9728 [Fusarium sp. NRRL 66182]